jgi:hypothetical protein
MADVYGKAAIASWQMAVNQIPSSLAVKAGRP